MADACLDTPDIDSHDKKDPLAVVDYVEDIYSYYRRVEVIRIEILVPQLFNCVAIKNKFLFE